MGKLANDDTLVGVTAISSLQLRYLKDHQDASTRCEYYRLRRPSSLSQRCADRTTAKHQLPQALATEQRREQTTLGCLHEVRLFLPGPANLRQPREATLYFHSNIPLADEQLAVYPDGKRFESDADRLFDVASKFFSLPLEEKIKYDFTERGTNFGYKPAGKSFVDKQGKKDRFEYYNVCFGTTVCLRMR